MYLKMKALRLKQLWTLALAGVGAVVLTFPVVAGDKIIVSDERVSSDPNRDLRLGNELFKVKAKLDQPGFDSSLIGIPTLPRVAYISRKEELRQQRKQEEKENWLLVAPGESDRKEQEESTLGVRNNPIDSLNKDERRNLTFYGVGESSRTPGQRLPGELRAPNSKQDQAEARQAAQQQRERIEAEEETRRQSKTFDLGGSTESQAGAHMASELNFSKMLEPGKAEGLAGADKAEFSLRSLMGTAPLRTKDQQTRMDDFNKLINAPAQQPSSFSGASSFSAQPAGGSAYSVKPPEPSSSRSAGNDLFGQNAANFSGGAANRLPLPGLPSLNNNQTYNPASPFQRQMPAVQDSSRNWMKPMEPQRRKF